MRLLFILNINTSCHSLDKLISIDLLVILSMAELIWSLGIKSQAHLTSLFMHKELSYLLTQ